MKYRVTYSPESQQHLSDIFLWIADQVSSEVAERFVMSIYDYCENLANFHHRGIMRDDLFRGMRILGFRRRVIIAFVVTDNKVEIYGVYYGGRDYETLIGNQN